MILRKHKIRNLVAAVCGTPWLIQQERLDAIVEFLNLRADGYELTKEEIQARIGSPMRVEQPQPQIVDGVAVLPFYGVHAPRMNMMLEISGGTSTQMFGQQFDAALANSSVRAIVLDVDSPGGQVTGLPEVAAKVYAARGVKPIETVATGAMCSGAFWFGTGASRVHVSPSTLIGSVGVVRVHSEASRADDREGRTTTVLTTSEHKADGNPYEPLSESARAAMKLQLGDVHRQFVAALAQHRGTTPEQVEANFGRGQVFYAERALAAGMVDSISTLEQVVRDLAAGRGFSQSTFGQRNAGRVSVSLSSIPREENRTVWENIKNALVARGFCNPAASEADVKASLNVFLAARGQNFTTEQAALDAVNASAVPGSPAVVTNPPSQPAVVSTPAPATPTVTQPAPVAGPVVPAPPDAAAIVAAERERVRQIQARGTLLQVPAASIQGAIDQGLSVEATLMMFTNQAAPQAQPVTRNPALPNGTTGSALDNIHVGAVEALFARSIQNVPALAGAAPTQLSAAAQPFRRMRLMQVAAATLNARGMRASEMDEDDIATSFLQLSGLNPVPFVVSGSPSGNTPGLYPNLLSALANKIMDLAVEYAETTYRQWCYIKTDMKDFKPHTFVALGAPGELPLVEDGDDFGQDKRAEEASWVATDMFGDEFHMTPVMMANDDLDGFGELANAYQIAHENTVGRLPVNLLTSNPTLPDGIALFHASHGGNLITSGAAPSATAFAGMRTAMRLQMDVGGKARLRVAPRFILVPAELETVNEQVLLPNLQMVAVTDATTNVFRSKLLPLCEPMLSDASAVAYYAVADPVRVRSIVVGFQQGFDAGGKKRTYYNPRNNCQVFQIEGRFGAAVRNFRGLVKNPGQ